MLNSTSTVKKYSERVLQRNINLFIFFFCFNLCTNLWNRQKDKNNVRTLHWINKYTSMTNIRRLYMYKFIHCTTLWFLLPIKGSTIRLKIPRCVVTNLSSPSPAVITTNPSMWCIRARESYFNKLQLVEIQPRC